MYQEICRLVTLAYPSPEALLVTHVGKEAFIAVLSDGKLQLEVMKQEPQNMEAALSHTIKFEAFEQSLASQGAMVNRNNGGATRRLCSLCALAGPSQADETAALHQLIGNLHATRVMAAVANGLWSDHTTPLKTASFVDYVRMLFRHRQHLDRALGQPSHEGGHGCADHQHAREMDLCHIWGQVGQQTDENDQQTEPANGTAMWQCVIWGIQARPADRHQCKRLRRRNCRARTTKLVESAAGVVAHTLQVASTSPAPVRATESGW